MAGNGSNLAQVLETTVGGLGLALVDFELSNHGRMLRLFIEREGAADPLSGITIEDCERVTRQLQRVLPVEGIDYDRLEVSSPGLDRVLKKPADFVRFAGQNAEVRLRVPVAGRRKFSGTLRGADAAALEMEVDGALQRFPLVDVDKARLAPRVEIPARPKAPGKAKPARRAADRSPKNIAEEGQS